MAIDRGEAAHCATDDGAGGERGRGGPLAWIERQPSVKWRRAFEKGELVEPYAALLPVSIWSAGEPENAIVEHEDQKTAGAGTIHIELPGRARISVEPGADAILLRCILESVCR